MNNNKYNVYKNIGKFASNQAAWYKIAHFIILLWHLQQQLLIRIIHLFFFFSSFSYTLFLSFVWFSKVLTTCTLFLFCQFKHPLQYFLLATSSKSNFPIEIYRTNSFPLIRNSFQLNLTFLRIFVENFDDLTTSFTKSSRQFYELYIPRANSFFYFRPSLPIKIISPFTTARNYTTDVVCHKKNIIKITKHFNTNLWRHLQFSFFSFF